MDGGENTINKVAVFPSEDMPQTRRKKRASPTWNHLQTGYTPGFRSSCLSPGGWGRYRVIWRSSSGGYLGTTAVVSVRRVGVGGECSGVGGVDEALAEGRR